MKTKKILSLVLCLIMLFSIVPLSANAASYTVIGADFTADGYFYHTTYRYYYTLNPSYQAVFSGGTVSLSPSYSQIFSDSTCSTFLQTEPQPGGTYYLKLCIQDNNNKGVYFNATKENCSVDIKGFDATVHKVINRNDYKYVEIIYELKMQPKKINSVEIINLDKPVAGQAPDEAAAVNSSEYKLSSMGGIGWQCKNDDGTWKTMSKTDDEKFEKGKTYRCNIQVFSTSGYAFPESKDDLTATINGETAVVGDSYSKSLIYIMKEYTIPDDLAFTKQPQSGTAYKTDEYTFNWELNKTPSEVYLELCSPADNYWIVYDIVTDETSASVRYKEQEATNGVGKFRLRAIAGSEEVCSDVFTVNWETKRYKISGNITGDLGDKDVTVEFYKDDKLIAVRDLYNSYIFNTDTPGTYVIEVYSDCYKAYCKEITITDSDVVHDVYLSSVCDIAVINGTASKTKASVGETVTITANQIDGKAFYCWDIDHSNADDMYAKETTVEIRGYDITATAIYNDCSCKCHGNFIQKLIFMITNFFAKLFNPAKRVCECGAKH